MGFEFSQKSNDLLEQLRAFMSAHIYPNEKEFEHQIHTANDKWTLPPLMVELREKAQAEGLWNLFMPNETHGAGLSNLDYAPLAEEMGRVEWAPQVFNCNAPDTGNMEVLEQYGTKAQQEEWLTPLLAGKIASGFCMTEPDVASSDATNVGSTILKDGGDYVINGKKWFTTGGTSDRCKILIFMGKTDPDNPNRHAQQSMILVPFDTPGVKLVRTPLTFGYSHAPNGHPEIHFENVRVPAENILLGEGRGFEIAQGRLGPGRIHHCMRSVGAAQRALELMCKRSEERSTFGKKLSQHQSIRENIAKSYCEIEQARLLTLQAADKMDKYGNKVAKDLIAAIKITAPSMACRVIDRAIQIHGGKGVTEDTFLPAAYVNQRTLRLADGPDEVHMMSLGRQLVRRYAVGAE